MSMATTSPAPAAMATSAAARPTPPMPTIATDSPGRTLAALMTAPPPVRTAQPRRAPTSAGTPSGSGTTECLSTTAYSANAETPPWWSRGWPLIRRRRSPWSSVPSALALVPSRHSAHPLEVQAVHSPQRGIKVIVTRCPILRSSQSSPSSSMIPEPSWPRTMGTAHTRTPLTRERSEWQTPAASMRIRTSPRPGASRVNSATLMGVVSPPRALMPPRWFPELLL